MTSSDMEIALNACWRRLFCVVECLLKVWTHVGGVGGVARNLSVALNLGVLTAKRLEATRHQR